MHAWRTSFLLLAAVLAGALVSCDQKGGGPLNIVCGNGFNAETGTVGDFGVTAAAAKVEAFLTATASVHHAASAIESDLLGACNAMATDLGIPASELAPTGDELEVTAVCGRVSQEIDTIVHDALPMGASLTATYTPPVCEVDVDVAASCTADCTVTATADVQASCDGTLVGSCSGSCSGECSGSCGATCTGTCSGTCMGACAGTCAQQGAGGMCAGACEGTCMGQCSGTCTASCDGTCTGECRGDCSVEWEAHCDGHATVEADADCKAACETRASAQATCTEPDLTIAYDAGMVDPAAQERLDALLVTLQTNYPKILAAAKHLEDLATSIDVFVSRLDGLADAVTDVSLQAIACTGAAFTVATQDAVQIRASVQVSVMVTASVEAGPM